MKNFRVLVLVLVSLFLLSPVVHSWGNDGHLTVCRIAQARLSKVAADVVKKLLPVSAGNDLGSLCSWADRVKFRYRWSSVLHYIDTPTNLCSYLYNRDCKDKRGVKSRCVAGAINNYTDQLLSYRSASAKYNLTEALLFLSHFIGDIHQPLHVGFTSDKGGNTINVTWYNRKAVLHHVWDSSIIETEEKTFSPANVNQVIDKIQLNITTIWAKQVMAWETCPRRQQTCPNIYASESVEAACQWAYNGVTQGSVLRGAYFRSRLPMVNLRLAQAGVRLAATLNKIFK